MTARQPNPMTTAIDEDAILDWLGELVTPVAGIPVAERESVFQGLRTVAYDDPDPAALTVVRDVLSVVVSVEPGERAAHYRSLERATRIQRFNARIPVAQVAGIAVRLANRSWPYWPAQESDDRPVSLLASVPLAPVAPIVRTLLVTVSPGFQG